MAEEALVFVEQLPKIINTKRGNWMTRIRDEFCIPRINSSHFGLAFTGSMNFAYRAPQMC